MPKLTLYIDASIRRISLLSFILVIVGAKLSGNSNYIEIILASIAGVLAVSLTNAHNNLNDAHFDRLNQHKYTLAVKKPIVAVLVVLMLLILMKISLAIDNYDTILLSYLVIVGFWYNYLFGRIKFAKEVIVAVSISCLPLLAIQNFTDSLAIFCVLVAIFFLDREHRKNKWFHDLVEDRIKLFKWPPKLDWWCVTGPILAGVLYIGSTYLLSNKWTFFDLIIAGSLSMLVWGYMQRKNDYRVPFLNNDQLGKISLLFGICVFPVAAYLSLAILVTNTLSMFSVQFCQQNKLATALFHSWLWATVIILACSVHGKFTHLAILFSLVVFMGVAIYEYSRPRQSFSIAG